MPRSMRFLSRKFTIDNRFKRNVQAWRSHRESETSRFAIERLEHRAMLAVTPALVPSLAVQIDSVEVAGVTTYTVSYENPQFALVMSSDAGDSIYLQAADSEWGVRYQVYDADPGVGSPAPLQFSVPDEEGDLRDAEGNALSGSRIRATPWLEPASEIEITGVALGQVAVNADATISVNLLQELVWDGAAVVGATYGTVVFAFADISVVGAASFTIPESARSVSQSVTADLSDVAESMISIATAIDSPGNVVLKADEIMLFAAITAENDVTLVASAGGLTMAEAPAPELAPNRLGDAAQPRPFGTRSYGTMPAARETAIISWVGNDVEVLRDSWIVQIDRSVGSPAAVIESLGESFATVDWAARALGGDYLRVVAPGTSQIDVVAWAAMQPGFRRIDPDYIVRSTALPNDPEYANGSLWGLENTGQSGGVVDADIDAAAAWEITTGSRGVVIGVIDTGIDYTHPDLAANIWTNPGEIAGNGIDDDANGYVDDVHGWDFLNDDNDPMDDDDHGTHVAGTIGAVGNNATGVVGVAWQVSMMALKTLGPTGGTLAAAIEAIGYATMMRERGVNVVATNNSWGFAPGVNPGGGLSTAIAAGGAAGILFVAAASNDANNNDVTPTYPSSYADPSIIAVAATTRTNTLASYSNYGVTRVDIGAPGSAIKSTVPGGGYTSLDGTSMATPHVGGVVALLASEYTMATAAEIKQAILESAVPIAALAGKVATGGLLNARGALNRLAEIIGAPVDPPPLRVTSHSGNVTLAAHAAIDLVVESSGSLSAVSAIEGVTLEHYGNFEVAAAGIKAADGKGVVIDAKGGINAGTGQIKAESLTITATQAVDITTQVETLTVETTNDAITVVEADGFDLGAGGIDAGSGGVSLTLTTGTVSRNEETITAGSLRVALLAAADLDLVTVADVIEIETSAGDIAVDNQGTFAVGSGGIIAGNGSDITITVAGGIEASDGVIAGGTLRLVATGNVAINTLITRDVEVDAGNADIDIEQDGTAINLASLTGSDISVTTTAAADIVLVDGSVAATGSVHLTAAGGILGTSDGYGDPATDPIPDIVAAATVLRSSGGILAATVMADGLDARSFGDDNDVDLTLVGSEDLFIGPVASEVKLAASGVLTFTSVNIVGRDPDTGDATGNDITISVVPTADSIVWRTRDAVRYVVTAAGAGVGAAGTFPSMLAAAGAAPNAHPDGTTQLRFAPTISQPVVLMGSLDVTTPIDIDGTRRVNPATGFTSIGRAIDVDGGQLADGDTDGFIFGAGAVSARLSGFAIFGFEEAAGAGVRIDGADLVSVENCVFGLTSAGRIRPNANGIVVASSTGARLRNNTVVESREAGIAVDGGDGAVAGLRIEGNHVGTERSRRRDHGNAVGIDLRGSYDAAEEGDARWSIRELVISDNVVDYNELAGVRAANVHDLDIVGNELSANGIGVTIEEDSDDVTIHGTMVVKGAGDGIMVTDRSRNVSIGGVGRGQGNFIGTSTRRSRGLGNRSNGVFIDASGLQNAVVGNVIVGNGVRRVSGQQNGVRVEGGAAVRITDNEISENRGDGIRIGLRTAAVPVVIDRNELFKNYGSGITLDGAHAMAEIGDLDARGVATVDTGNRLIGNMRYGIEGTAEAQAAIGVNVMNSNRRGGIFGGVRTPAVASAELVDGDLRVTLAEPLAADDLVYVYMAIGTRSKTQGNAFVGAVVAADGETEFVVAEVDPGLRVRRGSLITVIVRKAAGSSPFAPAARVTVS